MQCPQCNAAVQLPDELVGRQVTCGNCQAVFTAPKPAETTVTASAPTPKPAPEGSTQVKSAPARHDRRDAETSGMSTPE